MTQTCMVAEHEHLHQRLHEHVHSGVGTYALHARQIPLLWILSTYNTHSNKTSHNTKSTHITLYHRPFRKPGRHFRHFVNERAGSWVKKASLIFVFLDHFSCKQNPRVPALLFTEDLFTWLKPSLPSFVREQVRRVLDVALTLWLRLCFGCDQFFVVFFLMCTTILNQGLTHTLSRALTSIA